jgi:hypothetical protein
MCLVWIKTHVYATAIPGGVIVSPTPLAICRVAILHLASIIPTVKVLKHAGLISLVGVVERPMETHAASSVIISYSETTRVRI